MVSNLVHVVEPALIEDTKSYWAMHFCSIIETLYEHKQLEFNIQDSVPYGHPKTLMSFVGASERGFFSRMRESLRNWGLQYFLAHYLASNEGTTLFLAIINHISDNYNFDLLANFHSYGVHVCGVDSYTGEAFLRNSNAAIFGYQAENVSSVYEDIKYVDLCILIRRTSGDIMDTAILGEVEGNKGQKLFGPSGWVKKSSRCFFGIGVELGAPGITIQNIRLQNSIKTIATLGSKHAVIDDFHAAIGVMEVFMSLNPNHAVTRIIGQSDIIEIIRSHWVKPVEELIQVLRSFIHRAPSATLGINPVTVSLQSVPKIIV